MVKAGLLLCMFGGTNKATGDQVNVRSEPHVLVVGDPGLGKSQMLQACSNVAPRGKILNNKNFLSQFKCLFIFDKLYSSMYI